MTNAARRNCSRESAGVVCGRRAVGSQDAGADGLFAEERPFSPPPIVAAEGPNRHSSTHGPTDSDRYAREKVRVGQLQRILGVVGRLERRRRPQRERRRCGRRGDTPWRVRCDAQRVRFCRCRWRGNTGLDGDGSHEARTRRVCDMCAGERRRRRRARRSPRERRRQRSGRRRAGGREGGGEDRWRSVVERPLGWHWWRRAAASVGGDAARLGAGGVGDCAGSRL